MERYNPTPKNVVKVLYQMMHDVDRLFDGNHISYWITAGTLLGATRHKGIIPWDDDIDVSVDIKYKKVIHSTEFKKKLRECGYKLKDFAYGDKIISVNDESWIALDIFYTRTEKNKVIYNYKEARDIWPREYITNSELFPLQRVPFGSFTVTAPNKTRQILDRFYKGWVRNAYQQYNHEKDEPYDPVIKVKLDRESRQPAKPITVKRKKCVKLSSEPIIYFINCSSHKERLLTIKEKFDKQDIKNQRVPCVNGKKFTDKKICDLIDQGVVHKDTEMSPIEVAISMSHINVWERFLKTNSDYVIIVEDDVTLKHNFSKKVKSVLINVPDYDVIYLFNNDIFETSSELKLVAKITDKLEIYKETIPHNASGVGYILKRDYAEYLVKKAYPIRYAVDTFMGHTTFSKKHNYYSLSMNTDTSSDVLSIPPWTASQTTQHVDDNFNFKGKLVSDINCTRAKN